MRRHKRTFRSQEWSLVPLADMLTNTVGIMLFILIFTVLSAGGVVIAKRLPIERPTAAIPLHFICASDRIIFVPNSDLVQQFLGSLGEPAGFSAISGWLQRFNGRKVQTEQLVVTGEGDVEYSETAFRRSARLGLTIQVTPKPKAGESNTQLIEGGSGFRRILKEYPAPRYFVYFSVRPDSLTVFRTARAVAGEMGLNTGWAPMGAEDPLRFSLTGEGRSAVIQ